MNAEPTLYRLIARYWDAYDLLNLAMRATDQSEAANDGREDELRKAQSLASDRLDGEAIAICAFVPERLYDAQLKAAFVQGLIDRNDRLTDDEVDGLIAATSLACKLPARVVGFVPTRMVGGERDG